MELKGKCKVAFAKWLRPSITDDYRFGQALGGNFDTLPQSMQYGVLVDFFESVDIIFGRDVKGKRFLKAKGIIIIDCTRDEVIEQANKIYNDGIKRKV